MSKDRDLIHGLGTDSHVSWAKMKKKYPIIASSYKKENDFLCTDLFSGIMRVKGSVVRNTVRSLRNKTNVIILFRVSCKSVTSYIFNTFYSLRDMVIIPYLLKAYMHQLMDKERIYQLNYKKLNYTMYTNT